MIFTLNFDDFHPQSSKDGFDFGGDKEKGVFKYIKKLIDDFDIKITLFVPTNWIDVPYNTKIAFIKSKLGIKFDNFLKNEPFRLDKHKEWCNWLMEYVDRGNIEIGNHGLYHHNHSSLRHSQEFAGLDYKESLNRIKKSEEIFRKAGIKFVKLFRPPGWGISGGLFKALYKMNYSMSIFKSSFRLCKIGEIEGVKNIPQNYNINEPPSLGIKIGNECGVIHAKGHIVYNYGPEIIKNGLNEKNFKNLYSLIKKVKKESKVEFKFLSEMVK